MRCSVVFRKSRSRGSSESNESSSCGQTRAPAGHTGDNRPCTPPLGADGSRHAARTRNPTPFRVTAAEHPAVAVCRRRQGSLAARLPRAISRRPSPAVRRQPSSIRHRPSSSAAAARAAAAPRSIGAPSGGYSDPPTRRPGRLPAVDRAFVPLRSDKSGPAGRRRLRGHVSHCQPVGRHIFVYGVGTAPPRRARGHVTLHRWLAPVRARRVARRVFQPRRHCAVNSARIGQ